MSYEDVDEIKTQLHDAYLNGCVFIGEHPLAKAFEIEVFTSNRLKISVKIEVNNKI